MNNAKLKNILWRLSTGIFVFVLMFCSLSPHLFAETNADNVENTHETLDKWVETRRVISQEEHDWELGREMLNERVELVKREIDSIQGKMGEAKKNITEADKNRVALVEENEKLKEASTALNSVVLNLEKKTKALLERLPDPIRERIKPLSQRLPDNPQETKLSLSERFQNVVGILNEINKFNREITTTSEVRSLPDGSSAEVTALYVGLGQAYYVNASKTVAGIGNISDKGWIWTPANESAKQIADAVAVLKNEKVASFVQLPIKIQ